MAEKKFDPFTEAIGNVQLAEELFGDNQEISWLKETRWEYSRMTLTRDGRIDWKDEDKYDHDTTCFNGTYTLSGTSREFTVIGSGNSTSHYDAYKDSASSHFDKAVCKEFRSSRFTGEGFEFSRR